MKLRGAPIVISGPSGVGKGTVIKEALKRDEKLVLSISMTTRTPRPGESDGKDYFFVTHQQFEDAVQNQELVEWAQVYSNCYGTPKGYLEGHFEKGNDVVLELDVQGASLVRAHYIDAILIYIMPPSYAALKERLENRPRGEGDDLDQRTAAARNEMKLIGLFNYAIVNDNVKQAADEVIRIIHAERHRVQRVYHSLYERSILG
ncbi:guanylate kinase [bacterium]|nr:guanylate kinase [bacterium]